MSTPRYLLTGATFSSDQKHRYSLERVWDVMRPSVVFIGFNPSTADAFLDDPTIRRCVGFANSPQRWGNNAGQDSAPLFIWWGQSCPTSYYPSLAELADAMIAAELDQ